MTAFKHLLATVSVFIFGTAAQTYIQPESARAQAPVSEVELACERALNAGSIEEIEYFLNRYPASMYGNQTSCYSMAMEALDEFGPTTQNELSNNNDKRRGPYGG